MVNSLRLSALVLSFFGPFQAHAADPPVAGTLYQLSPQEVIAIKARAAEGKKTPNVPAGEMAFPEPGETIPDLIAPSPKRPVHGEIGFGIGTGGYRSVFGTVVYPVGDEGFVAFSFANSDFGDQGRRTRRR